MSTATAAVAVGEVKAEGIVKWFNAAKGFGFITPNDGSKELFVHFSGIVADGYKSLGEGDLVSFDAVDGKKGPQAVNVVVVQANGQRDVRPTPHHSKR